MARLLLAIEKGYDFEQPVQWFQPGGEEEIDLTGYSVFARFTVGDVTHELSEGSGIDVDDDNGLITVSLTDEETDEFEGHFGDYEIWVENPSGKKVPPLLEGPIYVST